jgi:transglutaminase-like putative cysteine protease
LPPGTPANRQLHFLLEKMRDHMTYTTHHLTKTLTETWDLKNGDCGNYADLAVGMAVLAGIPAKTVFGWYVVEDKKYKTHVACELYSQSRG